MVTIVPVPPKPSQVVRVRSRQYLVEEVVAAPNPGDQTLVRLTCLDDDSQGTALGRTLGKKATPRSSTTRPGRRLDLQPKCEFLLDHEGGDSNADNDAKPNKRKKPWRYRWPDDVRDEVLARLLALNQERAKEEALAGADERGPKHRRGRGRAQAILGPLFEDS